MTRVSALAAFSLLAAVAPLSQAAYVRDTQLSQLAVFARQAPAPSGTSCSPCDEINFTIANCKETSPTDINACVCTQTTQQTVAACVACLHQSGTSSSLDQEYIQYCKDSPNSSFFIGAGPSTGVNEPTSTNEGSGGIPEPTSTSEDLTSTSAASSPTPSAASPSNGGVVPSNTVSSSQAASRSVAGTQSSSTPRPNSGFQVQAGLMTAVGVAFSLAFAL